MSEIIAIAEAVVSELNEGEFSMEFTAERHYRPVFDLEDMKTLHVTVVPKGVEIRGASRGGLQYEYAIDVAVQKKLERGDAAEIDPLMTLVEELADYFRLRRLAALPAVAWVGTDNKPIYAQEHLEELQQFTSVLTFTFRTLR